MILRQFFLFSVLFFVSALQCQNSYVDSLQNLIREEKNDTVKAGYYERITRYWFSKGNPGEAIIPAQKVKKLGKSSYKITRALAFSYHVGASHHSRTGDYEMAAQLEDTALIIRKAINDKKGVVNSVNYKGIIEWYKGNYQKALSFYFEALKLCEQLKDSSLYLNTYTNIGIVYYNLEKYDQSVEYYGMALSSLDTLKQTELRASTIDNLGLAYFKMKDYDRALLLHQKALQLRTLNNDKENLGSSFLNIGNVYAARGDNAKAKLFYMKALAEKKETGDKLGIVHIHNSLADLWATENNFVQAKNSLLQGLSLAEEINSPEMLKEIYGNLAEFSNKSGDYKNAFQYLKKYIAVKDTLFNAENNQAMLEMESKYQNEKKENENKLLKQQNEIQKLASEKKDSDLKKQKNIIILISCGLLIIVGLSVIIYKSLRNTRKANAVIAQQKKEVEHQKDLINEKQKEILDSIHYAKRIQQALLASKDLLSRNLNAESGHFVYFNPKDIVSGDFYWATEQDNYFYLAVCDSTGHGVPGAFMSLLNIGFMSEAIKEHKILSPELVFNYVRKRLIQSISGDGQKDGFDGILLRINKTTGEKCYAAAHNRPVIFVNGEIAELACDKMPVGYGEREDGFTLHFVDPGLKGWLYLYTDGYADQFGGDKGKKLKYRSLHNLLAGYASCNATEQKEKLSTAFDHWKGALEQVDDVLLIGLKL